MDVTKLPDEELAIHISRRHGEDYGEVIKRYEKKLFSYVNAVLQNELTSHEVVQESFINAFKKLKGYSRRLKFSSWLYRETHLTLVNHLKSNNSLRKYLHDEAKILHFTQNLGYDEISDILQLPESHVIESIHHEKR